MCRFKAARRFALQTGHASPRQAWFVVGHGQKRVTRQDMRHNDSRLARELSLARVTGTLNARTVSVAAIGRAHATAQASLPRSAWNARGRRRWRGLLTRYANNVKTVSEVAISSIMRSHQWSSRTRVIRKPFQREAVGVEEYFVSGVAL